MSQYLWWLALTAVTGRPVASALVLIAVWLATDRFTLGLLPDPWRWLRRIGREQTLHRQLLANPHDGRARLELAGLLVERRAHRRAVEVLRPNLERGDDDAQTLVTMGEACIGAGYAEQGEALLARALEQDPDFRVGEVHLILGRGRLARGDHAGAQRALEALVAQRRGTVEGRVLLARACHRSGDDARAALLRDEAWREYVAAPRFHRRKERLWAWRARPTRPALYLAIALTGVALVAHQASSAHDAARRPPPGLSVGIDE